MSEKGVQMKSEAPAATVEVGMVERRKRPLRVSAPQVYPFKALDGVELRLTRYRGGTKGPVILSHGLGVSSLIFSTDTIETNMLEYLFAEGYDVWLLDHRASIDLPAADEQSSADDVALNDYPAAVNKVREVTGAETVQMVAHCYGSTTFTMAMLAGLQGVRSAVCSQISTHIKVPRATGVKTGLHIPSLLDALGVDTLTAYAGDHPDWRDRLYGVALNVYPIADEEECDSDTCRRITFMYGPLYEHDQLSAESHDALGELFGVASITSFEHLARMARAGHLVDAQGQEAYMPHLDRLAIPVTFIHGAENLCFLPESTAMTVEALSERNGADLYTRHVIPNYGHIDCIFGKNAARDIYPHVLKHLEATL